MDETLRREITAASYVIRYLRAVTGRIEKGPLPCTLDLSLGGSDLLTASVECRSNFQKELEYCPDCAGMLLDNVGMAARVFLTCVWICCWNMLE
jgi:hypothetical protein